jgi:hypothetical protein
MVSEDLVEMILDQYEQLELLVGMLTVKYGIRTSDGFQLHLDIEEALRLRAVMSMTEPTVLQTFDPTACRYVIDVV